MRAQQSVAECTAEKRVSVGLILSAARALKQIATKFWLGIREWSGDRAYERYLDAQDATPKQGILTPTEFYVEQLNRRYSRPNRCC